MSEPLLVTFNAGSSTVKFAVFSLRAPHERHGSGVLDLRRAPLSMKVTENGNTHDIPLKAKATEDLHEAMDEVLDWLDHHFGHGDIRATGHRIVHGGDLFSEPVLVDEAAITKMESLIPLAPLHQPFGLRMIAALRHVWPDLPQTVSFDTAFHRTQSDIERRFAIPREFFDKGVKRYGFHGLSYNYIAGALKEVSPRLATGKVVVAHLGSGASLCAIENGKSRDSSMGFSTIDGVPMATRCGALDPGVIFHLVHGLGLTLEAVEDMLYHTSGLLGLSGISADSRDLVASDRPEAREAMAVFAARIAREAAALSTCMGGFDGIVFTAGIGEHQPQVRKAVCERLAFLGLDLDDAANKANAALISTTTSRIEVRVIATDEEIVIARDALSLLDHAAGPPGKRRKTAA